MHSALVLDILHLTFHFQNRFRHDNDRLSEGFDREGHQLIVSIAECVIFDVSSKDRRVSGNNRVAIASWVYGQL